MFGLNMDDNFFWNLRTVLLEAFDAIEEHYKETHPQVSETQHTTPDVLPLPDYYHFSASLMSLNSVDHLVTA